METTTFNQAIPAYNAKVSKPSALSRFANWCSAQEDSRMLWIGLALAGHGCVLTPITAMVVLMTGNSLILLMIAVLAMAIALITNLAAMPTKVTIPVFLFSVVADVAVIAAAAAGVAG